LAKAGTKVITAKKKSGEEKNGTWGGKRGSEYLEEENLKEEDQKKGPDEANQTSIQPKKRDGDIPSTGKIAGSDYENQSKADARSRKEGGWPRFLGLANTQKQKKRRRVGQGERDREKTKTTCDEREDQTTAGETERGAMVPKLFQRQDGPNKFRGEPPNFPSGPQMIEGNQDARPTHPTRLSKRVGGGTEGNDESRRKISGFCCAR